jgi:hypothetical protein
MAAAWGLAVGTASLGTILVSPLAGAAVVAVAASFAVAGAPQLALPTDDLQRHISAARRRREPADVVVITLPRADPADLAALPRSLRLTDSTSVELAGDSLEIQMGLDRAGLDRAGFERRIATELRRPAQFGWATFPDDGVTVDAVVEAARHRALEAAAAGPRPARPRAAASATSLPPSLTSGAERWS